LNKEKLEVTLLKAELESEKSKSEFGFNVALLVRNSVFRKSLIDSKNIAQYRGKTETIIHLKNTFQNSNENYY
jgi:hypothetical protein